MKILIAFMMGAASLIAQTGAFAPVPIQQPLGNAGQILIGACLYTYATGTTTPLATYSNQGLTIANANPIVLNSSGRAPAIFISAVSYKFVLANRFANTCPATPGTVIWSQDPVFDTGQQARAALNTFIALLASSAGSAQVGFLQQGTGAVSETEQTKMRQIVNVADFGAVGDWTAGTNGTNNCTALTRAAAAVSIGGYLYFAPGRYRSSCAITMSLPASYIGAGPGDDCLTSPTCLIFNAGVSGIINTNTSRGSSVRDIYIQSLSTLAGSDHGVTMGNSRFHMENLVIDHFGGAGVYNTANNVDDSSFNRLLIRNGLDDGYYCTGAGGGECNKMVGSNSEARGNAGFGWHMGTGGAGGTYTSLVGVANTLGDFKDEGNSNIWIGPYCEGASTFTLAGTNTFYQAVAFGQCTILVSGVGYLSSTICSTDAGTGTPTCNGRGFSPLNPTTATPTVYGWLSGDYAANCASIHDFTNNVNPLAYCPTLGWIFGKPITQSTSSPIDFLRPDNTGAGALGVKLRLNGYNSLSASAPYAQYSFGILANTSAAQTGAISIQAAIAGTLTDVITSDATGRAIFNSSKTTGAAGGKAVVCMDTATGAIYASSTGTDCSN